VLPGLLTDAQHASRELAGDDQAQALNVAAHAYNTASSVLRKLGDNELALIAADRAVQAAKSVDDPLLLGASAYRLANVFLPTGRLVEAKEVALSAAAGLDSRPDASGAHLAMWGSLLLTAALAAARQGDASEAWELMGEGKTAARRLEPSTPTSTRSSGQRAWRSLECRWRRSLGMVAMCFGERSWLTRCGCLRT
jgi:hypothetical protein